MGEKIGKEFVTSEVGIGKTRVTPFLFYFCLNSWATPGKELRTDVRLGLYCDNFLISVV